MKHIDKLYHFIAGFVISFLVETIWPVPSAGFIAATTIGVGKEVVWDFLMKKGTPDAADAVATAIGGATASALRIFLGTFHA